VLKSSSICQFNVSIHKNECSMALQWVAGFFGWLVVGPH
jgi:hypothetical protein